MSTLKSLVKVRAQASKKINDSARNFLRSQVRKHGPVCGEGWTALAFSHAVQKLAVDFVIEGGGKLAFQPEGKSLD